MYVRSGGVLNRSRWTDPYTAPGPRLVVYRYTTRRRSIGPIQTQLIGLVPVRTRPQDRKLRDA